MKLFKKLTTLVLFVAILIGSFFSFGLSIKGANTQVNEINPDELITVVVELKDAPLLEENPHALTDNGEMTIAALASYNEIIRKQETVLKDIEELFTEEEFALLYTYSYAMNGFAAQVPARSLNAIAKIDGVSSVYTDFAYDMVPSMASASEMVNVANGENISQYTGKGTVIAVIDSGLDLDHEAFQMLPDGSQKALDASTVEGFLNSGLLNASTQAANVGVTLSSDTASNLTLVNDNWDVYLNDKVPFAFNYTAATKQYFIPDHLEGYTSDHGTHVAGIAAGYKENDEGAVTFSGIAPNSQLLVMKIFGNERSGYWTDILAALEDSLILGADVINMSLGSTAGFSYAGERPGTEDVYNNLMDAGVIIACAAGNEYTSAYGNLYGNDLSLASNPDNGSLGSPASYDGSYAVASVENNKIFTKVFKVNERDIVYSNNATAADRNANALVGADVEYEILFGDNNEVLTGVQADFDAFCQTTDITGKVIVVKRGATFTETVAIAESKGAKGLIVFDHSDGALINMSENTSVHIPSLFISKADGEYMVANYLAGYKTLTVSDIPIFAANPGGNQMAASSSWGVTPDLKLKPEITAPGGSIYSSIGGGGYGVKSGTSMATPVIAGLSALMVEYTGSKIDAAGNLTGHERQAIIKALLTSTAEPVMFDESMPYSPRKQGAGLADLQKATNSGAYLTVDGSPTPKADLGDDKDKTGLYQIEFNIVNFSQKDQTYAISADVLTERVEIQDVTHTLEIKNFDTNTITSDLTGVKFMSGEPYSLNNHATVFTNYRNDEVTVAANSTAKVTVVISIDENARDYLDNNFENGIYVEGFIKLTHKDPAGVNLGLPFVAFYGDWTEAPIIDEGTWMEAYSGETILPQMAYSTGYKVTSSALFGDTLGILGTTRAYDVPSWFASSNTKYLPERNTFTTESSTSEGAGIYSLVSAQTSLLRNAKNMCYQVYYLKDGVTIDQINDYKNYDDIVDFDRLITEQNKSYIRKTYYDSETMKLAGYYTSDRFYWDGKDDNNQDIPGGTTVMIVVTAELDNTAGNGTNENYRYMFPVKIDHAAPKITNVEATMENGDLTLNFDVNDNMYLSDIQYTIYGTSNGTEGIILSEAGLMPGDHIISSVAGETKKLTKVFEDIFSNPKWPKIDHIDFIRLEVKDFASETSLYPIVIRPIYKIELNSSSVYITEGSTVDFTIDANFGGKYSESDAFQPNLTLPNDDIVVTSSRPDLVTYDEVNNKLVSTNASLTELTDVTITVRGYFNYLEEKSFVIKVIPSAMQNAVDESISGSGSLDWTFGDSDISLEIDDDLILDFAGATINGLENKAAITVNNGNVTIKNVAINQTISRDISKADALNYMLTGGIPGIAINGGNVTLENVTINGEEISFASGKYFVSSAVNLTNNATLTLKATELRGVYGINNVVENAIAGGMITIVDASIKGSVSSVKNYINGTNVTINAGSTAYDGTKAYEDAVSGLASESMLNGTADNQYRKGDLYFDFSDPNELSEWTITGGTMEIVNLGTDAAPDNYAKFTTTSTNCYISRTLKADAMYTTSQALDVWYVYHRSAGTNLPYQLWLTYKDDPVERQIFQQWCGSNTANIVKSLKPMTSYTTGYLEGKVVTDVKIKIAPDKAAGSSMLLKAFTKTQTFKIDPYEQNDMSINTAPTDLLVIKDAAVVMSNPSYTVNQSIGEYSVTVTADNSNMNQGFNQKFDFSWIPSAATLVKGNNRYECTTPTVVGNDYTFSFKNLPTNLGECEIVFDYALYSAVTGEVYANAITEGYTTTKAMYDAQMLDEFIEEVFVNSLQLDEIENTINQIFTNFENMEEGLKNRDAKKWDTPMTSSRFATNYPELAGTLIGHPDDGGIYRGATNSAGPYWATAYNGTVGYYLNTVEPAIKSAIPFKDNILDPNTGKLFDYRKLVNAFLNIYDDGISNGDSGINILTAQIEWINQNYQELILKLSLLISALKYDTALTASHSGSKLTLWDYLSYSMTPNEYIVKYGIEPFDNSLYENSVNSLRDYSISLMNFRASLFESGFASQGIVNILNYGKTTTSGESYIGVLLNGKATKYSSLFINLSNEYYMKRITNSFSSTVSLVE